MSKIEVKTKKIGARVTEEQKKKVIELAKESNMKESEYVLSCCLKRGKAIKLYDTSPGTQIRNPTKLDIRVTEDEMKQIRKRYEQTDIKHFSRFVRNCCLDNPIIIISDLKDFSKELNKIGNNLNQLTMLCHQGLIATPDILETKDTLQLIYKELTAINKKVKLGR